MVEDVIQPTTTSTTVVALDYSTVTRDTRFLNNDTDTSVQW